MMNKVLLATVLLLSFKCGIGQSNSAITIKVIYVNFRTETFVSVPCERFEGTFTGVERTRWTPENQQQTDSLIKFAHDFKPSKWPNVDTRATIEWERNGTIIHYCFDGAGNFTDGNKIYRNKALFNFLKRHLPIN